MPTPPAPETIEVFLIDDDEDHLSLLSSAIENSERIGPADPAWSVRCFTDPTRALAALPVGKPAVIVSDYNMPGGTGLDWLGDYLKAAVGPVLLLTGHGDEHVAAEAFRAGASDYLNKFHVLENPGALQRAIREALRRHRLEQHNRTLARELKAVNGDLELKHGNLQQLTRAMTHDLQTPLVGLTGAVDALRKHLGSAVDAVTTRWLDRLEGAATRAMAMLDDLMLYAKAGEDSGQPGPTDLGAALSQIIDEIGPLASGRGVQIESPPVSASVIAEEQGLRRLVSNLIGNAVKYSESPAGGRVTVRVQQTPDSVQLRIADNGPGIPPEHLQSVLLPFKRLRADKPGTGLGLSIAKRYADRFGGRLWLESDGKSGTTAVAELLPATPQAASKEPQS